MPETSIIRKIYKWKHLQVDQWEGRWEDDVRNDLRKLKVTKWAEQVQHPLKWKDIVEKAKTTRVAEKEEEEEE